ncbi:MAG: helix-hairpin-helix domain-containing protein [Fimbriimonas sp.]
MFSHLPTRHQYGFLGIGVIGLAFIAFFGAQELRRPAPMTIRELPAPPIVAPSPPLVPQTTLVVHVAGAVKKPSVIEVKSGDRVHDAVRMAGGALAEADLDEINLAAKLEDGVQVYVPKRGEPDAPVAEIYAGGSRAVSRYSSRPKGGKRRSTRAATTPSGPVSLNTGSLAQLDTLPGIGPSTAQKILDYRHEHGGFSSIDELLAVPGIGSKKLEKMRKYLKL